jgi:MFS family permease
MASRAIIHNGPTEYKQAAPFFALFYLGRDPWLSGAMIAPAKPPVPKAFFLVAGANFLQFLNVAFFFLLPIWVLEHGGGEAVAGRVISVSGISGLLILPLLGYLLDRFGRRRFLFFGALLTAVCSFAFIWIEEVGPALILVRILQGIAFSCAFTGAQTLAVLFAPHARRAEALGWFGISTILTHAISPPLGEEIIRRWGYDAMFATAGCVGVLAVILCCFVPKAPELHVPEGTSVPEKRRSRRVLMAATAAMLCYGFGFGAVQTFGPTLIERFDLGRIGVFFITWSVVAVSMRLLFGSASDRYGRRPIIVPAMIMMSLSVALFAYVRSSAGIVAVGFVFGVSQGLLYPTMNALVADWSSPHNIGRTQSYFSGSFGVGIHGCAFFFGSIVEAYGYTTMFLACLAITIVGMVIFLAGTEEAGAHSEDSLVTADRPALP